MRRLLPLSARSDPALRELAGRYVAWLDDTPHGSLADLAWTAGVGRSHFAYRAGVVFTAAADLRRRLKEVVESGAPGAAEEAPKVAFLFTGQGSQWGGMGLDLFEREPVTREVFERCEAVCREERAASLLDVMFGRPGSVGDLDETEWAQPALYALESALCALWESVGVRPDVVLGHSIGEIVAAQAAGVFGLEAGMRFALRRGALMGSLPPGGTMAAVFAPAERVRAALAEADAGRSGAGLDVAAFNGTHQVVSGPVEHVTALERRLEEDGVRTRRLRVSHAFHSRLMEPVLDRLQEAAGHLGAEACSIPLVSNVTGEVAGSGAVLDAGYWRRHARSPVAFGASVETLARLGANVVVEIGPGAVLGPLALQSWPSSGAAPRAVSSPCSGRDGAEGFVDAVAAAYTAGLTVSFASLFAGQERQRVSAPLYPFQRVRYWVGGRQESHRIPHEAEFSEGELVARLREAPVSEREGLVLAFVLEEARGMLRLAAPPAAETGFFDLGMDSLMLAELRNRLNRALAGACEISQAEVFSHPDATRLARRLAAAFEPAPAPRLEPVVRVGRAEERIAIVGMACRFPGGPDLAAFWKQLATGRDAVTRGRPDHVVVDAETDEAAPWGAYVAGMDRFDAEFFRIAPVEAELMDPQQRLLLETSWEALEHGGIAPDRLKGSRTGVYVGMFTRDYQDLLPASVRSLYRSTGSSFSAAIGRVAFTLGLEGPAIAVDTACSSSLVAIHQAAAGLQRGDADLVLAGGVNAIFTAGLTEAFGEAGMLSPDGRCKTFDALADGYVRGEGCGMLVLKRLSDAERDGDRILGVLLGSAVNQDGASAGLTVPNGVAQQRVIAEALERAGVAPAEVDYLEAHGTGTELGDPIEVEAAAAAYGAGRHRDRPLLLGSVKTNVGHLEAAAGIAGVIKVLLSMREGAIPKHLHFERPNPRVDWERLPVRVTSSMTAWPVSDRPVRAGVSSFGYSGTNAHVVLEGYGPPGGEAGRPDGVAPDLTPTSARALDGRETRLLPLSGRSGNALRQLAGRYLGWLEARSGALTPELLPDLTWTAGTGRSHFAHRAGLVFEDEAELRERLEALAAAPRGCGAASPGKVAFLFTGQGSQWVGMGRDLYQREPMARAVLDRCEQVFREERGASLLEVMFDAAGSSGDASASSPGDLDATEWTQPALYALQAALSALWSGVDVRPDVVLGHSVGEIAAAQAAGVFGVAEGMRFASRRGALMGALPATGGSAGGMVAVFASSQPVLKALEEVNAGVSGVGLSLAADNGAHQVVSGPVALVSALGDRLDREGIRTTSLATSHGFHSGLMEPVLQDLREAASQLSPSAPSIPFVSNVTGRVAGPEELRDAGYWARQARSPVAFGAGVRTLSALGVDVLVELGPRPVLGPMAALCWPDSAGDAGLGPTVLSSLAGPAGPCSDFVRAVAGAYEAGVAVSFAGLFAGESRRRLSLPTYPFQRERYWVKAPERRRRGVDGPLVGEGRSLATGEMVFETELSASDPVWLEDHRVFGQVVVPGAFFGAQAALAFGAAVVRGAARGRVAVGNVRIERPLALMETGTDAEAADPSRLVQLVLGAPAGASSRSFEIFSRAGQDEPWVRHAAGEVGPGDGLDERALSPRDIEHLKRTLSPWDSRDVYRQLAEAGLAYGPAFRGISAAWSGNEEALADVMLPDGAEASGLDIHPVVLDACFQMVVAAVLAGGEGGRESAWLPIGWDELQLEERLPERIRCHARLVPVTDGVESETRKADLTLQALDGAALGRVRGFSLRRANRSGLLAATAGVDDLLYEVTWRDSSAEAPGVFRSAEFLQNPGSVASGASHLSDHLDAEGVDAERTASLASGLETLARAHALAAVEDLGWQRRAGVAVDPEALRRKLKVVEQHRRLFGRLLHMLGEAGVLARAGGGDPGWVVAPVSGERMPGSPADPAVDPEALAQRLARQHPEGSVEIGLLRRCGAALGEVLRGRADGLDLLFAAEPSAADLYRAAPGYRAVNRLVAEAVEAAVSELPADRRLRVLEVGAGTGGTTGAVLPVLPPGRTDYVYTDVSAGFFATAEERFGGAGAGIEYRVLDIERDPAEQGFDAHRYDLIVAANVLHATRDLGETLAHCRRLLGPSGLLVALEGTEVRGWLDLTFGLLDGWWRFDDAYRTDHALVGAPVWRRALSEAGYEAVEFLGRGTDVARETGASTAGDGAFGRSTGDAGMPGRPTAAVGAAVILARGPSEVLEDAGLWVVWPGGASEDRAAALVQELRGRGQTVVAAGASGEAGPSFDPSRRESWRAFFEKLPAGVPLRGVVHLGALAGHGADATPAELSEDVRSTVSSALALVQGLSDAGTPPAAGLWFVTCGGQVVGQETAGRLHGSGLWGFGRTVARELGDLRVRLIDVDPEDAAPLGPLAGELLYPDRETEVVWRSGRRLVSRLVPRPLCADPPPAGDWRLVPNPDGSLDRLQVERIDARPLGSREIRVAVEAAGLNFADVMVGMGLVDLDWRLGGEMCGRVVEVGSAAGEVSAGDRVVGFGAGTLGTVVVTRPELVAPAPSGMSAAALATVPTVFVTAAIALELADVAAGDRILLHAGTGGVGHAAIQLARAAGLRVMATASAPKQGYLRSLGVEAVFDSRSTAFGEAVLEATGGAGVAMVLNSLTGEGFIEASLTCLASEGRFVEIAKRGIWSPEEMASRRPDVGYHVLAVDRLVAQEPDRVGTVLRGVVERMSAGELVPLPYQRWPLSQTGAAMERMRSARHIGKIVLTPSALARSVFRADRSYLVTGGLGGIGLRVAGWLADRGAGAIVLNGRRPPDEAAEKVIGTLRGRGVDVRAVPADVSDGAAIERMLSELSDAGLPPLGGVIHGVGALSDGALANQDWESFERVLWPKVLGAWHLHRATEGLDLDLFLLFSSFAGVLGNAGQANHAAANAFLDQLATHRRARGLAGQSIQWGPWSGIGEAEEQRERIAARLAASGVGWIAPEQGLRALTRLVREDAGSSAVMALDLASIDGRGRALLAELASAPGTEASSGPAGDQLTRLRGGAVGRQVEVLLRFVREEVRSVLRLPSLPSPDVGFFDLGMDSLMAVELRTRLNRELAGALVVPSTVVFDHPNPARLARYLSEELGELDDERATPRPLPRPAARGRDGLIAVVGMACRFPGGPDLESFWRQLESGGEAVTKGRPDGPTLNLEPAGPALWGAYLSGLDRFDAEFFRIAPLEAELLDPQQRLLLETSWEALEHAGLDPGGLEGSRTGVYAGICWNDYRELASVGRDPGSGFYLATGSSFSTAIGRVAFTLGFEGPAIAVDTACSSSLVAIHQAVAGLQSGETDLALAGGVNAILSAGVTEAFAGAGMLSPDGRCKTFDASADGYVRGEGCGVLVLKRLSDAERDGDRILGVVLGSAVNQDGASAGLTVPNGPAQERVIAAALERAGIEPSEVDYLEAHGTGTELGDPIEVRASASAYGAGRPAERPLLLGSVKTNIGHLEAAAGVAGVIKVLLSMRAGVIPRHLHFERPNPRVDWERLPVRVTASASAWPSGADRPPRAGVSSFGYSGTNAHVVVEGHGVAGEDAAAPVEVAEPPEGVARPAAGGAWLPVRSASPPPNVHPETAPGTEPPAAREVRLLPLSGRTDEALRQLAGRYVAWLDRRRGEPPPALLADMAWTAGTGRSHFACRAGVVFEDAKDLRAQLEALAAAPAAARPGPAGKVAFLFTGQGSQWAGMGRGLYEREPAARAVLDRCEAVFREERGASLLAVMFGAAGSSGDTAGAEAPDSRDDLDATAWTQPALYALEAALSALWSSVGVRPDVVLGHSVGEIAAAHAAGVFDVEAGMRFACRRGALMGSLPRTGEAAGGMTAVFAASERVQAALVAVSAGASGTGLSLAADNGAHQVVSGPLGPLRGLEEHLAAEGIRTSRLTTSHAFHSGLMDPVLAELEAAASVLVGSSPSTPLVSNVTGRVAGPEELLDGGYWRRQARSAVAFGSGVRTLSGLGVGLLVEVGPRSVLGPMAALCWPASEEAAGPAPAVLSSLAGPGGADADFVRAAAEAYEAGVSVSFAGLFAGESRRRVSLPTYPFQRERYWVASAPRRAPAFDDPLLGARRDLPAGEVSFEIDATELDWLLDHRLLGRVVAPGSLYGAQAIAAFAADAVGEPSSGAVAVEDVQIERPLALPERDPADGDRAPSRRVQLILSKAQGSGPRSFEVFSRGAREEGWTRHAAGRVRADSATGRHGLSAAGMERLKRELSPVPAAELYRRCAVRGLRFGPAFRGVTGAWLGASEALGEVAAPDALREVGAGVHPAVLDACLQLAAAVAVSPDGADDEQTVWLAVGWERLWMAGCLPARVVCHARLASGPDAPESAERSVDLAFHAPDGAVLGGVHGMALRRSSRTALLAAAASVDDLLYEVAWRDAAQPGGLRPSDFLRGPAAVVAGAAKLSEHLEAEGLDIGRVESFAGGLETLSRAYALETLEALGWERSAGSTVDPEALRRKLRVVEQHRRLFGHLLGMLADVGVLARPGDGGADWTVALGAGSPAPGLPADPDAFADRLIERHPEGAVETGLLRRCGAALGEVLRGRADGMDLLFGGEPNGADLYLAAPGYRALNRLVAEAVASAMSALPADRRLRVLEVGAGTGGTTSVLLPLLPEGRTDYTYTDISAGFFATAEERFGGAGDGIEYRVLDIERDPAGTGVRRAPLRPGGGGERAACDARPGRDARALPAAAGAIRNARGAGGDVTARGLAGR